MAGAKPGPPTKSGPKVTLKPEKAKAILNDGEVRGKSLTPKQRKFMGARAGAQPMLPGMGTPGGPPMKGGKPGGIGTPRRSTK